MYSIRAWLKINISVLYKLSAYYLQIIKFLKGESPKNENLLNIMSLQTCMNFFLWWNIIWEIQEMFVYTVEIMGK